MEYQQVKTNRVVQTTTTSVKSNGQTLSTKIDIVNNGEQDRRIQNISKQMQIFLMAIELERLSDQNYKLTQRLKNMEDHQFNTMNLEQQIIDLKQKMNLLDQQYQTVLIQKEEIQYNYEEIIKFQEKNEDNQIILKNEIEKLRVKLRDFEEQKQNEISAIIKQKDLEAQKLLQKHQQENDFNWQQQMEYTNKELQKFKELHYQIKKENTELKTLLQQQDLSKNRELELTIIQYKNDIDRLNQNLNKYQIENQHLKERIYNVDQIQQELEKLSSENLELNENLQYLQNENQEKKIECEAFQEELEKLRYGLSLKTQELDEYRVKNTKFEKTQMDFQRNKKSLDEKFTIMQQEIDRLQLIIRQKSSEIENIQKKIHDNSAEKQRLIELEYLQKLNDKKNMDLDKRNQELNQRLIDQTKKTSEFEKYNNDLTKQNNDLTKQNNDLTKQNNDLAKQTNDLTKQNNDLAKQNNDLTFQYNKVQEKCDGFEVRYNNLLLEIDKINKQFALKTQENEAMNKQIIDSKIKLANYDSQLQELYDQISILEQDIEKLKKYEENCRVLSYEIDRLNNVIGQQENELKNWRLQYSNEGSLNKRIVELLSIMFVLMIEIESLRNSIIKKDKQIEDLRNQNLAQFKEKNK
ncbi:unnamed protein product [Paramecium sonneborni]|uniref:Uncharacterized protein n=1 Tax=Paramecium sonneborni TaxID=65129 RepID=A0A8S1KVV1_9CILI|nr:unnamed protein product [Paramecium sonneborni]